MDFTAMILKILVASAFNVHTYVGIAVGAICAPLWIALYNYVKVLIVEKIPGSALFIAMFEKSVDKLEDKIAPVTDMLEKKTEEEKNDGK